jgi:hypothetical protein
MSVYTFCRYSTFLINFLLPSAPNREKNSQSRDQMSTSTIKIFRAEVHKEHFCLKT